MLAPVRLLNLPPQRRALLWACGRALLVAAWAVRTKPFARCVAGLGPPASPDAAAAADGSRSAPTPALAQEVRWAMAAWTRRLPWPPTCLMQAMAARAILVEHGVACELYFGVQSQSQSRGEAPGRHAIGAHAWLRCAGIVVTGEAEAAAFAPIAVYRFAPPLPPARA